MQCKSMAFLRSKWLESRDYDYCKLWWISRAVSHTSAKVQNTMKVCLSVDRVLGGRIPCTPT